MQWKCLSQREANWATWDETYSSLIPYANQRASSKWERRDAETCQLKLQDTSGFGGAPRGLRRASCSVQVFSIQMTTKKVPKSFIHSINKDFAIRPLTYPTRIYGTLLWTELCPPKTHRLKPWPPVLTIFGNRAYNELIKVKWRHQDGAGPQSVGGWLFMRKEKMPEISLPPYTHSGKGRWGQSKKAAVYKTGRKCSPETNPESTLILGF